MRLKKKRQERKRDNESVGNLCVLGCHTQASMYNNGKQQGFTLTA